MIRGTFKHTEPVDLFLRIKKEKLTGDLKIQKGNLKKLVYFIDGTPVHILSNKKSESLGQILLKLGRINEQDLEKALIQQKETGKKLGTIFIEKGKISNSELRTLLKKQAILKLREICTWDEGKFLFEKRTPEEIKKVGVITPIPLYEFIIYGIHKKASEDEIDEIIDNLRNGKIAFSENAEKILNEYGLLTDIAKQLIPLVKNRGAKALDSIYEQYNPRTIEGWLLLLKKLKLIQEKAHTSSNTSVTFGGEVTYEKFGKEVIEDEDLYQKYIELKKKNYYEILGISKDASQGEIKKAYFKLAKEMHPDKFFDPVKKKPVREAELIFSLINEAFQTLSDPEKKKEYDEYLQTGKTKEDKIREAENAIKAETEFEKGKIFLKNRNLRAAENSFKTAYELVKDPEFKAYYGWTKFVNNFRNKNPEWKKGATLINEAIKENPQLVMGHLFYGKVLSAINRFNDAYNEFRKVLELDENNEEAKRELTILEKKIKDEKGKKDKGGLLGKLFGKE